MKVLNTMMYFMMVVFIFFTIIIHISKKEKYPYLNYEDKISGKISTVKNDRGSHFFILKNSKMFRVRLDDGNFDADDLLSNYTDFDTIYKHAKSDTLYFRRDGKLKYALIYYKKGK